MSCRQGNAARSWQLQKQLVTCQINLPPAQRRWLPLGAAMEAWYTSTSFCGFDAEDAPYGSARLPSANLLLVAVVIHRLHHYG